MTENASQPDARAARWLLAGAALFGALVQVLLPPWQGEDEPWHLEVAHWISRGHLPLGRGRFEAPSDPEAHAASAQFVHHRFPGVSNEAARAYEEEVLASLEAYELPARVDWAPFSVDGRSFDEFQYAFTQVRQPPLYYLLAGAWLAPFQARDPAVELRIARVLSLLCYLATVALSLALAREVLPDERAALLAAALVALWPTSVRQAAVVNNDALAGTLSAAVLWLSARLARGRLGRRGLLALVAACALGLFTKSTAAGAVAVAGLALLVRRSPKLGRALLPLAGLAAAGAAVFALLWFQDSPLLPRTAGNLRQRLDRGLSSESFAWSWRTLVGTFGWESRELPREAYRLALAATIAGCALAVPGARRLGADGRGLLLCSAAVAAQALLLVLRGAAAGRYALPALPALAVLVACGLAGTAPTASRGRVAAAAAALLVVLLAAWLGGGLVQHAWARFGA